MKYCKLKKTAMIDRAKMTRPQAKSSKGELARNNLKQACLRVLERVAFHNMRINDVTAEAGVATGLFYHYFKDLKSLTIEVLSDFIANSQNVAAIEKNVAKGDWFARIYAHNILVVKTYAAKPEVMRSLFQLADTDAEFAKTLKASFIQQLQWLVSVMPRLFPEAAMSEHQALMVVYTLASSGEVVLRDYFIDKDPVLTAEKLSVEAIAELLSVIFYRGLFLQNPPEEKLHFTRHLLKMQRVGGI